jgi:HEAT repeat protein
VIVSTFIDFAFLSEVQYQFKTEASLAYFLGLFFSLGKVVTLLTKLFFSGRLVERLGIRTSLLILPLLLLGFGLAMLLAQAIGTSHLGLLWIFGLMMLSNDVLRYAVHDPVFLALFQPLNQHLRLHGHTIVKGLIDPLALTLAGASLGAFLFLQGRADLRVINYALLLLVSGWALMVVYTNRVYLATVSQAIGRRFLEGSGLLLGGKHVQELLQERLASDRPEEVIYAMSLLEKAKSNQFAEALPALFQHPAEVVQRYALERAGALADPALREPVLSLARSNAGPEVRSAALRTLAALGEDAADGMITFLDDPSLEVRKGATIGLLRNGGIEGVVLAGQQLLSLTASDIPTEKATAAEIIGELKIRNFYQPISRFIADDNSLVKSSGIQAAGNIQNQNLLPMILPYLHVRQWREEATKAFAQFGEAGISLLSDQVNSASEPDQGQLIHYCRVAAQAGGAAAHELLLQLARSEERVVRETAWQSLLMCNFQAAGGRRNQLEQQLQEQLQLWHYCFQAQAVFSYNPDLAQLHNAFYLEAQQLKAPVFQLLGLLYSPETIAKAEVGLVSHQKEAAANALEMLEGLLPRALSARLLPFLDALPLPERLRQLEPHFGKSTLETGQILQYVLERGTEVFFSWTVAMVLSSDGWRHTRELRNAADTYSVHPNRLLREAYRFSTRKLAVPAFPDSFSSEPNEPVVSTHHHSPGLLQLEKVILLKSTPIFAETPENILVEVAEIAHEVRVEAGHTIFHKGELGSNMYVIYEGDIRIHDGDHTFTEFHARDIFGELALLDPEPRSASATATTESLLLRLDQEAFSELMAERKEVAKGVFRVLCRRLRSQNELITQLRQHQPIAGA